MPKRSGLTLNDIAEWDNLVQAAYRAARGKRLHSAVRCYFHNLDENLSTLRRELLDGSVQVEGASTFRIFDPKPRIIHAPAFPQRVLHHALMRHVGPILERSLIDDTFACRVGKGAIAAAARAQLFSRRFDWYGKLDVRHYFANICHATLKEMLARKFKDSGLLELLGRIIGAHEVLPGRGLPIGALTSQNFANFYLNPLDRFLLEDLRVRGIIRYMDDVVWWCDSKAEAHTAATFAQQFLSRRLSLQIKPPMQVNRSVRGIAICGYRVFPGVIGLSRRRRKLYRLARRKGEVRFREGRADARELQWAYSATLASTLHADAISWRRGELARRPPLDICLAV